MSTATAIRRIEHVGIVPGGLYRRRAFLAILGIGANTVRTAKRHGLPLPAIRLGKQFLVPGSLGIGWAERAAELQRQESPP